MDRKHLRAALAVLVLSAWFSGGQPVAASGAADLHDWSDVSLTAFAQELSVQLTDTSTVHGLFVSANDASVTLMRQDSPYVKRVKKDFVDLARRRPQAFADALNTHYNFGGNSDLKIGPDGIFERGTRIGDNTDLFLVIPRKQVVKILGPLERHRSWLGSLTGAAAFGVAGFYAGVGMALDDSPCQPHCGRRGYGALLLVWGSPLLGAELGNRVANPPRRDVIYERAPR